MVFLFFVFLFIPISKNFFIISPYDLRGEYNYFGAQFGGFYLTPNCVDLELVFSSPLLACSELSNNFTGYLVAVERGRCTFLTKAFNVEQAGGNGMVIMNNVYNNFAHMSHDNSNSKTDGEKIYSFYVKNPEIPIIVRFGECIDFSYYS